MQEEQCTLATTAGILGMLQRLQTGEDSRLGGDAGGGRAAGLLAPRSVRLEDARCGAGFGFSTRSDNPGCACDAPLAASGGLAKSRALGPCGAL